jgi:AraC-like DNA-binding protein
MILATVVCVVSGDKLEQRQYDSQTSFISAKQSTSVDNVNSLAGIGNLSQEASLPTLHNMFGSVVALIGVCAIIFETYSKKKAVNGYGFMGVAPSESERHNAPDPQDGKRCDAMTLSSIVETLRTLVQDEEMPDKFRGTISNICGNVSKMIIDEPELAQIDTKCAADINELPMCEPESSESTKLSKCDEEFLARLTQLIEDNMTSEKLDIEFMTDKFNMSHSTFYRKVKSLTGLTAVDFIRKVKLRNSVILLKTNKYSISEISYMTGFNSPAHFRQAFKDEYKMSPSQSIKQSV